MKGASETQDSVRTAAETLHEVRTIVDEWLDAPAWPGPDPVKFMARIVKAVRPMGATPG